MTSYLFSMSLKRKKRSRIWFIPSEEFTEIVRTSRTIREMVSRCGLRNIGGNFHTVLRRVKEDGLDISHIPRGLGNRKGSGGHRKAVPLDTVLVENSPYSRCQLKRRLLHDGLLENKCFECGLLPEWNGRPLVLRLDHINGVNNDNRIGNLRLLCPNCDSQSSTFTGRNNRGVNIYRYCSACGKRVSKPSKKCKSCAGHDRVGLNCKAFWPSYEELKRRVEASNNIAVAIELGVTETAVRRMMKRMKRRNDDNSGLVSRI